MYVYDFVRQKGFRTRGDNLFEIVLPSVGEGLERKCIRQCDCLIDRLSVINSVRQTRFVLPKRNGGVKHKLSKRVRQSELSYRKSELTGDKGVSARQINRLTETRKKLSKTNQRKLSC